MKYQEHKTKIEGLLRSNAYLFEPHEALATKVSSPMNNKVSIYVPSDNNRNIRLRGGIGYLSAQELLKIDERNEITDVITYSYVFCLENFKYVCNSNRPTDVSIPAVYKFRYEKDTQNVTKHPAHHLHVVHELPRYYSAQTSFQEFIAFVKVNFYDSDNKAWLTVPHWNRT